VAAEGLISGVRLNRNNSIEPQMNNHERRASWAPLHLFRSPNDEFEIIEPFLCAKASLSSSIVVHLRFALDRFG
jgi:hypothetical protein